MSWRPRLAVLLAFGAIGGCQTAEPLRYEGVTAGAGDAIAANTVMQMVDPWPAGVEDTNLRTPADHDQYRRQTIEVDAGSAVEAEGIATD